MRYSISAIALFATIGLLACSERDVDRDGYVRANEAVLASVPAESRAELAGTTSAPYYKEDGAGAPIAGYTTTQVYRLAPGSTPEAVAAFYERELPTGWQLVERLPAQGGAGPVLNFRRGRAALSVNLENASHGTYELTADHDAYG
jgi:hypothetical protein